MGCCSSQSSVNTGGNVLVEGFLKYTQSTAGWTREKSSRKDVFLEVFKADVPLGTFRGHVSIKDVTLDDVLSYVKYKLGTDTYELLEQDEDEAIYREYFDFQTYKERNKALMHAGDHRGETAERMDEAQRAKNPRQPAVATASVRNSLDDRKAKFKKGQSNLLTVGEEGDDRDTNSKERASKDDEQDSSDGDDDVEDYESTAARPSIADATNGNESLSGSGRLTHTDSRSWHSRLLLMSSKKLKSSKSLRKEKSKEFPARREMIFQRQDFGLGEHRAAVIAQSVKYSKRALAKRCTVHLMGVLIEETIERKKPRVKLTYICSIDPDFASWEIPLADPDAVSHLGGKDRCELFLASTLDFLSDPNNRLLSRFRQVASAPVGALGWEEVERSKNELQLGTNVQHPVYGHGVVQSFDMKGRVRVVYDNKQVVDHEASQKDELRVAVMIGTRVSHPDRGLGTVKAFDEHGRIHVKFDNGELHRYKQEAWKKKMHSVKLLGIGGALGNVRLSWRPFDPVREGMGRVKFAVGVSCEHVLEYILENNSSTNADEEKSGSIIERRVVQVISDCERVIYEHRKMPPPLTPRDFVFKEVWSELAANTYAIVYQSVKREDLPDRPGIVRGEMHTSGWLLEPLYLDEESYDGEDHVCKITFQMCIDAKGFVPPESVEAVRQAQLLGALTDTRAYFWEQSQLKSKQVKVNRMSKRGSELTTTTKDASAQGLGRIASMLKVTGSSGGNGG